MFFAILFVRINYLLFCACCWRESRCLCAALHMTACVLNDIEEIIV